MLSRTADHLFWMCRYIERAENTARMLSVNAYVSLLPRGEETHQQSWRAMLRISELEQAYEARYGELSLDTIVYFLVRDADNPSSIYSCLRASRENARAVRGSLTTELWETCNSTWLTLVRERDDDSWKRNPERLFEWVKYRSQLVRGVIENTMLDDEVLHFMRLGTHLERADNMARMLDVRFHEADAPGRAQHRAGLDAESGSEFYRWSAILACVSALEIYRKVYRDVITPARVAELLVYNGAMPSSLLSSMRTVKTNLARVANDRSGETERLAGRLLAELEYGRIEDTLRGQGLHRFLTNFLARINDLGARISRDFLVSPRH